MHGSGDLHTNHASELLSSEDLKNAQLRSSHNLRAGLFSRQQTAKNSGQDGDDGDADSFNFEEKDSYSAGNIGGSSYPDSKGIEPEDEESKAPVFGKPSAQTLSDEFANKLKTSSPGKERKSSGRILTDSMRNR